MNDLRSDDRGLAIGVVAFFLMLIIGIALFILFDPAMDIVFSASLHHAETAEGANQINLAQSIWAGVVFYILFVSFLYLIAKSVVESRRGV